MNTPKDWIVWYYRVKDSHGAPALSFVDSEGRLYAERCAKCKHTRRHALKGGVGYACGHCGEVWPFEDRFLLKGEIQRSLKFDGLEMKHARQFDIGRLLSVLLREHEIEGHLFVANAMDHSIRSLMENGPQMWPHWDCAWTKHAVQHAIASGAAYWGDALERAGIPTVRH